LKDTRSTTETRRFPNLIHYLIHLLEEAGKADTLDFLTEISEANAACKIGIRALLASAIEIKKGFTATIKLLDKMQSLASLPMGDNFIIRFVSFISSVGGRMQSLEEKAGEVTGEVERIVRYFGEDFGMEEPESIFAMLKSFQDDLVVCFFLV
jgi:hypothetical protein